MDLRALLLGSAVASLGCPAADDDSNLETGVPADGGSTPQTDTGEDGPGATSMLPGSTGMADDDGLSGVTLSGGVDTEGDVGDTGPTRGESEGGIDTGGSSAACEGIDHGACWAEITAAWSSNEPLDAEAIAAFEACYANPAVPLPSERLIDLCTAELFEECLAGGGAECGAAYCECTLGSDPFDWTSCWAITMAACDQGTSFSGSEECLAIVEASGCWAGAASQDLDACYGATIDDESCSCPMCVDDWAVCDAAMQTCLSGG